MIVQTYSVHSARLHDKGLLQADAQLLARYFESKEVLDEVDYPSLKETKPDALFSAWLTLSDGQRHAMDSEFQMIHDLSSEKGFRAILDEAEWHFEGKPEDQAAFVTRL